MTTRRQFINQTVLAGASLALASACRRSAGSTHAADPSDIRTFAATLRGRVVLPGDRDYDAARRVEWWSPETDKRPAMLVQCASDDDVARSIECARRHELGISVRSGGHSFMGWGIGDGLVIDVSRMKDVSIDARRRIARCGTGATAGELVNAAARHGLAPVLGQCPSVGAGLALGGGLGWLAGIHGAACDNLLAARLITAGADSMTTSSTSQEDLFWAIRGGGGNFGVATEFEYRLHPVRDVLAGGLAYPARDARPVLRFFRDFMAAAPDELQALANLSSGDGGTLLILLVHSGEPDAGEPLVRQLRAFKTPQKDWVERRPYADVYTMPPYSGGGGVPCASHAIRGTYVERLSDEAIDLVLERFAAPPPACEFGFNLDHYTHGQVCRVAPDATAFALRTPGAIHLAFGAEWDAPERAAACTAWLDETWKHLQAYSGGRMYANYMSVTGTHAAQAAYDRSYSRLASIKRRYDPDNVFRGNLNIAPA